MYISNMVNIWVLDITHCYITLTYAATWYAIDWVCIRHAYLRCTLSSSLTLPIPYYVTCCIDATHVALAQHVAFIPLQVSHLHNMSHLCNIWHNAMGYPLASMFIFYTWHNGAPNDKIRAISALTGTLYVLSDGLRGSLSDDWVK